MAAPRLFDYNTSFGLLRTNPKLTGNVKISLDSSGGVWLNSMNANPTLSDQKYKKFQVTGEDSYSSDLFRFFLDGSLSNDIIFETGEFTDGNKQSVDDFQYQYDFFYGAGASTLIDRNYSENFRYFQPLWLRDELPEFFVIFKIPGPLSYPYTTNQNVITDGVEYKVIEDPDSIEDFIISYGKNEFAENILYSNNGIFDGNSLYATYSIISGTGKVIEMNELKYKEEVDNISDLFNGKILPNSMVISTFDLRSETTIGKYIRSIVNDKGYTKTPIDFSLQKNTYTYYNGVSIKDGVFTKKGELLSEYLISENASIQSDFEEKITGGFERNGIICPNLLNLEFLFDDKDSDLYTINRYYGCYVSRNDLGEFKLNGDYFYKFKNKNGNINEPKPTRNNIGYYYNNISSYQSSTGGVRLFYEGASGWLPGSYDANINDAQKLYYITDKNDNFYSLARSENYLPTSGTWDNSTPSYSTYGPYASTGFGITGDTTLDTGDVVIFNKSIDLLNFTGHGDIIGSYKGLLPQTNGYANIDIKFLNTLNYENKIVFKIFWPNGTKNSTDGRYDLVRSGEFGGTLVGWRPGSSYNVDDEHYFNAIEGKTSDVAKSFSECITDMSTVIWDSVANENTSIIRSKESGYKPNNSFKIGVFDDYENFSANYIGQWITETNYTADEIVYYDNIYYTCRTRGILYSIIPPPEEPSQWDIYLPFSTSGILEIGGIDASLVDVLTPFIGGTDYGLCRVAFNISEIDKITAGDWIEVENGRGVTGGMSIIESISRYVDSPVYNNDINNRTGAVTSFNGYDELLVANLREQKAIIDLGSDGKFNIFEMAISYSGVFSFFDIKDFDFDFLSSVYGITPTPETHRYFELIPDQRGQITEEVKYLIKDGLARVDVGLGTERVLSAGETFIGTSVDYFTDAGLASTGVSVIVVPATFMQLGWIEEGAGYEHVKLAEENLDGFPGFYGIQSINETGILVSDNKELEFVYGKLNNEYLYLEENYTSERANRSKIVPYINKWGFSNGTDARGNPYRLNVSPAFSPTNFSPSFQKESPDPQYLTHEWMLLEGIPREFPIANIADQKGYLPGQVDLSKIVSGASGDSLYFSSFFTVDPLDYDSPYNISTNLTKELFTPLVYNKSTGFYDTIFRGVKLTLKRKSTVGTPNNDKDKYISNYRGFDDYKFAAILRVLPEDDSIIQSPVTYEFIENIEQKCILFVCKVIVKDYRALPLGYPGGTGGTPYLDYTLLYSLSDKKKNALVGLTGAPGPTGSPLYEIDDIKLSAALDLSVVSNSSVTPTTNPGFIYIESNPNYDTDLREEINLFYPVDASSTLGITGAGSFSVPALSSNYPWPIGRSKNLVSFGPLGTNYEFDIPFATFSPVNIPLGSSSTYRDNPVFQRIGGKNYFDFIIKRISVSEISDRVNVESPYIDYTTYSWEDDTSSTTSESDRFQISMVQPTAMHRNTGLKPLADYSGPQTLGQNQPTGYEIVSGGTLFAADILRYAGGYEPLFRKVFRFKSDKIDTIYGYNTADLRYRNCTFAPEKEEFGIIKNIGYSKVSLGDDILKASENLPVGPAYPLIGETPIANKDFSIFYSSWDPGYYNMYTSATTQSAVAGTRTMKENKSFLGSKIMQTPYSITSYTFTTLEVSRTRGSTSINNINNSATSALNAIQLVKPSTSNIGIGQLGAVYSTVDLPVFDQDIFPDVEVFWQKDTRTNTLYGSIRLDRILRRYLLNSGVSKVFIDNIISEYGVDNPNDINDDIKSYLDRNISPIYKGIDFDLYVKKSGKSLTSTQTLVRGDLINPDRIKYSYYLEPNYKLTRVNSLVYNFELKLEEGQNYSTTFTFKIEKI